MKKIVTGLLLLLMATITSADDVPAYPFVEIETTEGIIRLQLEGRRTPLTVGNFLKHVDDGFYDGTIFHRVIPGFMIQGGGYTPDLKSREPDETIPNESGNGLQNSRGTIAMARQSDPHTANTQFYINVVDNSRTLDPRPDRWGYTVFGYVVEGMEIVDKIANVRTGPAGQFSSDVPVVPVLIKKISRYDP